MPSDDPRTDEQRRYDAICDQVVEATRLVKRMAEIIPQGQTQTVIHKTQGMGAWTAAAVAACFCTLFLMVLFAVVIVPDIHDLKAWNDITRKDIARIQAQLEKNK